MRIKYLEIAALLETRIANGTYRDMLPSTRLLADELHITLQTLGRSTRILIEKGLLRSTPAGIVIAKKPEGTQLHRNHIVGIMVNENTSRTNIELTPRLNTISEALKQSGLHPFFMRIPDQELTDDENFWSNLHIGGYLFYGCCTEKIARILHHLHIPALSLNQVPYSWQITSICFDGILEQLIPEILKSGYQRIAIIQIVNQQIRQSNYHEILQRNESLLQQFNPGQPSYLPDFFQPELKIPCDPETELKLNTEYLKKLARWLTEQPEPPDAVICLTADAVDSVQQKFAECNFIHGKNFALITTQCSYRQWHNVTLVQNADFPQFARLAVDHYRMLLEEPGRACYRTFFPYPLKFVTLLPPKKVIWD